MQHSVAANVLAELPDGGTPQFHRAADRRGEELSPRRPERSRLSSYLTALMIAAGLVSLWAGICYI